jgi:predicted nucleotidyltransferase
LRRDSVRRLSQKRNLKKLVKCLVPIDGVKAVILYGSFARGDFGPRSDLDLFIITDRAGTRNAVFRALAGLELDRRIQPTVRSEAELRKTDSGLLQNIFDEGKLVYLREPMDIRVSVLLGLSAFSIFTFELTRLDQKTKVKFNREMYESGRGSYRYGGVLGKIGGERLSRGCAIVPVRARASLMRFFKKYRVRFQETKVWR